MTELTEGAGSGSSDGKPVVSRAKLAANRLNAKKSTGPRTAAGKRKSSRNATRHGIFADCTVIVDGIGHEDPALFDALLAGLREELSPKGEMQEVLVQRLASIAWRQRRVLRFEIGSIMEESHGEALAATVSEIEGHTVHMQTCKALLSEISALDPLMSPSSELVSELAYMLLNDADVSLRRVLGQEVNIDAPRGVPPEKVRELFRLYCKTMKRTAKQAWQDMHDLVGERVAGHAAMISRLRAGIEHLAMLTALPSDEREGKILRYEGHLSREFQRTLQQLQMLQRAWLAQDPPS